MLRFLMENYGMFMCAWTFIELGALGLVFAYL